MVTASQLEIGALGDSLAGIKLQQVVQMPWHVNMRKWLSQQHC